MRRLSLIGIVALGVAQACVAQSGAVVPEQPSRTTGICLFTGVPAPEYTYTVIKKLKYGKGSYGSVNDLLPRVVADANSLGADAIIQYNGAQHFGFFPWRFVRPVVTGTAIKWSPARNVDCAGAGGHYTYGTLDEAPPAAPRG